MNEPAVNPDVTPQPGATPPAEPAANPSPPAEPVEPAPVTPPIPPAPEVTPPAADGLPDDAIRLPEDQNATDEPQGGGPTEEELQALEQQADAIGAPEPAITQPGAQPPAQQPTVEERVANIEGYLQQITQQQQTLAPQVQTVQSGANPAQPGVADVYTQQPPADPDPYAQSDPYSQSPQPQPQPQQASSEYQNIMREVQEAKDWAGIVYNQNQELRQELQQQKQQAESDQQAARFKDKYNVDDATIARASKFMQEGKLLEAFTLVEGRSKAQAAGDAMREQRAQSRELSGTQSVPGNAVDNNPNANFAAAKAAYDAAMAQTDKMAKDLAIIELRRNYPEEARTLMENQIGGSLLTEVSGNIPT